MMVEVASVERGWAAARDWLGAGVLISSDGEDLPPWLRGRRPYILFVLLAALLFSPFLLQGKVLFASTDLLFNHYPNLIFGHRALRRGDFGLWNPYIFAGIDFTTSMHHHMLRPFNWILLAFPESLLFHAQTAIVMIEVALIGALAFTLARRFLRDSWRALLVAVTVQLGGFTWFSITTLIGVQMFFATLVAVYCLLTAGDRRPVTNYLILSAAFADIMLVGHVIYVLAFGFVLLGFAGAAVWSARWRAGGLGLAIVIVAAGLTAVLGSGYRLWPVLTALLFEQMVAHGQWLPAIANAGYYVLTGFIPDLLGYHLGEAMRISGTLGLGIRHTQFHALLYFGVASLLLLVLALGRAFGTAAFVLTLAGMLVSVAPLFLLQPVTDLVYLLLFPAGHDMIPRTVGPGLLLLGLAFALRAESWRSMAERAWRGFVALSGGVIAVSVVLYVKVLHEVHDAEMPGLWPTVFLVLRLAVVAILLGTVVLTWRGRFTPGYSARMTNVAIVVFTLVLLAGVAVGLGVRPLRSSWLTRQGLAAALGTGLWAAAVVLITRRQARPEQAASGRLSAALLGTAVLLLLLPLPEASGGRGLNATGFAAVLGIAKFVLLTAVVLELFTRAAHDPRIRLIPLLVLLTLGDLLFFHTLYRNVGAPGFVSASTLYPAAPRLPDANDVDAAATSPNLLINPSFDRTGGGPPSGWSPGGAGVHVETEPNSSTIIRVRNTASDAATLYQDLVPAPSAGALSFGAWVRTGTLNAVGLLATTPSKSAHSSFHTGLGGWEWLNLSLSYHRSEAFVRPHIFVKGPGSFEVFAPRLIAGAIVLPSETPPGADPATLPVPTPITAGEVDLSSYRVNHPARLTGHPWGEVFSSVPMVYGVATYGGVDSDVKQSLYRFLRAFDPAESEWFSRGGVKAILSEPRALDLLGVRYETSSSGVVVVRPNAIARVSLFEEYEVISDGEAAVAKLRSPEFDPARILVVDRDPGWRSIAVGAATPHFRKLAYRSPQTNHIEVDLRLASPGLVLFNDGYSRFWRASFAGRDLPIMRANVHFMAVSVPPGEGTLVLRFAPTPFLGLVRLALAVAAVWLLVVAYTILTYVRGRRYRADADGPLPVS